MRRGNSLIDSISWPIRMVNHQRKKAISLELTLAQEEPRISEWENNQIQRISTYIKCRKMGELVLRKLTLGPFGNEIEALKGKWNEMD